jgi:hypothetical protein
MLRLFFHFIQGIQRCATTEQNTLVRAAFVYIQHDPARYLWEHPNFVRANPRRLGDVERQFTVEGVRHSATGG